MYTYLKAFIGIPLNQYAYNVRLASKQFMQELEDLASEDLTIQRYVEEKSLFKDDLSPSALTLMENLEKLFNNEPGYEKFQTFVTEYPIDFEVNYNGANECPAILGCYVEELCPLPDTEVGKINVNMTEISRLSNLFEELAEKLFAPHDYQKLKMDNLIGAFYNIHSS